MMHDSLTEAQRAALRKGLEGHAALVARFGNDPAYRRNLENVFIGYRAMAEALAGDGLRKIDYVLRPLLDEISPGDAVRIGGLTLRRMEPDAGADLFATVYGREGNPVCKINWTADRANVTEVDLLPYSGDVAWEIREPIAHATLVSSVGGSRADQTSSGTLWMHNFHAFIDAMDVLQPALAERIAGIPRGRPFADGVPYSMEEISKVAYADAIALDGGLPGALCRAMLDHMMEGRGGIAMETVASAATSLAELAEEAGCMWGSAFLSLSEGATKCCTIRSEAGELGLLFVNRSYFGEWNSFLSSRTDDALFRLTALRHSEVIGAVTAFRTGSEIPFPTSVLDMETGRHDVSRRMIETGVLDLALHDARFGLEGLAKARTTGDARFCEVDPRWDAFLDSVACCDDYEGDGPTPVSPN